MIAGLCVSAFLYLLLQLHLTKWQPAAVEA